MNDPAQKVLSLCLECHKNLTSTHSECSHKDHTAHSWDSYRQFTFLTKKKVIAFICSRKADLFPLVLNEHIYL